MATNVSSRSTSNRPAVLSMRDGGRLCVQRVSKKVNNLSSMLFPLNADLMRIEVLIGGHKPTLLESSGLDEYSVVRCAPAGDVVAFSH